MSENTEKTIVSVSDEFGTFQAEPAQIQRILRKRKREAAEREKQFQASNERAAKNSRLNGFRILSSLWEYRETGNGIPAAWTIAGSGSHYAPRCLDESGFRTYTIETADGTGQFQFHCSARIDSALIDSSGWPIAAILHDSFTNELTAHAIGCADGIVRFTRLPVSAIDLISAVSRDVQAQV